MPTSLAPAEAAKAHGVVLLFKAGHSVRYASSSISWTISRGTSRRLASRLRRVRGRPAMMSPEGSKGAPQRWICGAQPGGG